MRGYALALVLLFTGACRPVVAPPPIVPSGPLPVRQGLPAGGETTLLVEPSYLTGAPVRVELRVTAGDVAVRGPVAGRILASGFTSELQVRALADEALASISVAPHASGRTTVTWDAREDAGGDAPPDTYQLVLEFAVGSERPVLGTVVELRAN